ncbi:hypothetical protein [Streptomyces umbrinus]|uniref:hypothetical protein n=1 Tax=Streptomyces umbrinus TaxID=67370 RepID=UPI003C2B5365
MIEYDPGSGLPPDPVEQRLRDALRARVLFASARWEGPRQAPPANGPSAPPTPTTPGAVTASPDGGRP